uniref:Uncharacterized protein n=1 Tax=Nicotiana tabacum TaxID=4097 RepID=A0A1S3ZY57_TOBAC|nr:PREDICTED: uncharacterized protein LOC107791696 [Nicotiana tabacum]
MPVSTSRTHVNAHLVNWPNLVHILAHTQIMSDRCKVVAISVPSSALGHKESCPSPSLQYASICLRKGKTASAFGLMIASSAAGLFIPILLFFDFSPLKKQKFEYSWLDICNLNITIRDLD